MASERPSSGPMTQVRREPCLTISLWIRAENSGLVHERPRGSRLMGEGSLRTAASSSCKVFTNTHLMVAVDVSRLVYSASAEISQGCLVLPMPRMFILSIVWDPAREMFSFNLPLLNRPILWYGFFFALGFFLGFWVLRYLLSQKEGLKVSGKEAAEQITFYVLMGAVIGARLGDVLFYQDFSCFLHNPLAIIKFWEGGLASHGGAVGILVALTLLSTGKRKERLQLSFRNILDLVVIPTALAGALIRVGNFFNQEILGKATTLPWGVRFLHPMDGSAPIVRHPVQIYESLFYFGLFLFFLILWKRRPSMRAEGKVSGLFIILMFTFRFLIEFIKAEQSVYIASDAWLTMGQYLSLPFIGLGLLLFFSFKWVGLRNRLRIK